MKSLQHDVDAQYIQEYPDTGFEMQPKITTWDVMLFRQYLHFALDPLLDDIQCPVWSPRPFILDETGMNYHAPDYYDQVNSGAKRIAYIWGNTGQMLINHTRAAATSFLELYSILNGRNVSYGDLIPIDSKGNQTQDFVSAVAILDNRSATPVLVYRFGFPDPDTTKEIDILV